MHPPSCVSHAAPHGQVTRKTWPHNQECFPNSSPNHFLPKCTSPWCQRFSKESGNASNVHLQPQLLEVRTPPPRDTFQLTRVPNTPLENRTAHGTCPAAQIVSWCNVILLTHRLNQSSYAYVFHPLDLCYPKAQQTSLQWDTNGEASCPPWMLEGSET